MRPNDEISAFFSCLSPPLLAIYYAFTFLFEEKFSKICIRNYKKMESNRLVVATYFAPKHIAICSKTQCILQQNAVHFAAKRTAICTKMQGKMQQNARLNAAKCSQNP